MVLKIASLFRLGERAGVNAALPTPRSSATSLTISLNTSYAFWREARFFVVDLACPRPGLCRSTGTLHLFILARLVHDGELGDLIYSRTSSEGFSSLAAVAEFDLHLP